MLLLSAPRKTRVLCMHVRVAVTNRTQMDTLVWYSIYFSVAVLAHWRVDGYVLCFRARSRLHDVQCVALQRVPRTYSLTLGAAFIIYNDRPTRALGHSTESCLSHNG